MSEVPLYRGVNYPLHKLRTLLLAEGLIFSIRPCRGHYNINAQRFRGGLVFKAHRLLYHSTLGLRVIKKKKMRRAVGAQLYRGTLLTRNSTPLGPYSRTMHRALWWP